jgi:hypothetical protein
MNLSVRFGSKTSKGRSRGPLHNGGHNVTERMMDFDDLTGFNRFWPAQRLQAIDADSVCLHLIVVESLWTLPCHPIWKL